MFTLRFGAAAGFHKMSCVKLPAAVAFPTDDRLLKRIEESRRALPANNVKPLWKIRGFAPVEDIALEAELRSHTDSQACVVPLARAAGSPGRGRGGISVSAA
jgi:hypothetical protein